MRPASSWLVGRTPRDRRPDSGRVTPSPSAGMKRQISSSRGEIGYGSLSRAEEDRTVAEHDLDEALGRMGGARMSRRRFLYLAALSGSAAALAACAGSNTSPSASAVSAASPAATAAGA